MRHSRSSTSEPTGLHVSQGDVVRFNLVTPDHTVTAYHPWAWSAAPSTGGCPPFSSPVPAGESFWLYRFDETGVYDMLCAPHEIFGMVGRVVVGEASADWMDDDDDDDTTDDSGMTETGTSTETATPGAGGGEGQNCNLPNSQQRSFRRPRTGRRKYPGPGAGELGRPRRRE